MKKPIWMLALMVAIALSSATVSFAHPGRTDANGGHTDRSTGKYHYHNSGTTTTKTATPKPTKPPVTLSINPGIFVLSTKDTQQLTCETANVGTVTYETDDKHIASVTKAGKVTAHASGAALITVHSASLKEYGEAVAICVGDDIAEIFPVGEHSQGEGVKILQGALAYLGYLELSIQDIDGEFGPVTAAALTNYRTDNTLAQTDTVTLDDIAAMLDVVTQAAA